MKKNIIIGGGPAGIALANKFEKAHISYILLEGNQHLGGQLMELYPHKEIVDIPNVAPMEAQNYIKNQISSLSKENIIFDEAVSNINEKDNYVEVIAKHRTYQAINVIIATGLGQYIPRKIELENEDSCSNILYSLKNYDFLKNKKVLIFGGGDSALDWSKGISKISDNVSLIHRRTEFRGNIDTIKDCKNIKIYTPFIPNKLIVKNGKVQAVIIKNVATEELKELSCDYVLVNYGSIPSPISFALPKENAFLKVDLNQKCKSHIYSIGDACTYEGKIKRIAPALKEVEKVFNSIKEEY
jgi:thioredoxin reductase (NADPH)